MFKAHGLTLAAGEEIPAGVELKDWGWQRLIERGDLFSLFVAEMFPGGRTSWHRHGVESTVRRAGGQVILDTRDGPYGYELNGVAYVASASVHRIRSADGGFFVDTYFSHECQTLRDKSRSGADIREAGRGVEIGVNDWAWVSRKHGGVGLRVADAERVDKSIGLVIPRVGARLEAI